MERRIAMSTCAVVAVFVVRSFFSADAAAARQELPPSVGATSLTRSHVPFDGASTLHPPPSPPCAADGLLQGPPPTQPAGERYLVYAPQFGLSNQLVALRNAVAWAQILNRTLVLPHLLAHGTVHPRAAFGLAFDAASARTAIAPLRVVEIDAFLRLGLAPSGIVVLATTNRFRAADGSAYFDSLGVTWHRASDGGASRVLSVPMAARSTADGAYSPAVIAHTFGGCGRSHAVLAFQSLFAAFDPKPLSVSPPGWTVCAPNGCRPGLPWLDQTALPALLAPSLALESIAARIASELTASDEASGAPNGRELLCAHIRRGDFREECVQYDIERGRKGARSWVVWHHRHGWGCWQTESELSLNLRDGVTPRARRWGETPRPVAVYASIEDAKALAEMPSLRPFNITSLATFQHVLSEASLPLPPALAAILVDQLTCAHASRLLLNVYSTFSQLVMGRLGLRRRGVRGAALGWVRDLTKKQAAALGVTVAFWRREETAGQLVAGPV